MWGMKVVLSSLFPIYSLSISEFLLSFFFVAKEKIQAKILGRKDEVYSAR